jgi:hypothetical protein
MTTTKIVPAQFAQKSDTVTAAYSVATTLLAVYTDVTNSYVYAIDDKQVIRKMSITRDPAYARKQFKLAKKLVGQKVIFGVTKGWNPNQWFNDVTAA